LIWWSLNSYISGGIPGSQNPIFGYSESAKNGLKTSWTRVFFIFLPIFFVIFDDFSNFRSAFGMFQFEKSSNMAKMKKSLVQLAFNPFLHGNVALIIIRDVAIPDTQLFGIPTRSAATRTLCPARTYMETLFFRLRVQTLTDKY